MRVLDDLEAFYVGRVCNGKQWKTAHGTNPSEDSVLGRRLGQRVTRVRVDGGAATGQAFRSRDRRVVTRALSVNAALLCGLVLCQLGRLELSHSTSDLFAVIVNRIAIRLIFMRYHRMFTDRTRFQPQSTRASVHDELVG